MAKCANCATDALYTYKVTDSFSINYCQLHLPKFLNAQKLAGLLKPEVEAPKASKKKSDVVEETPVEEAPEDDATN
jgi:hypothetical protein